MIDLFSGMPPETMLLHVVHVMSKNPGVEIWHTNIMELMIMAGVVFLTPIITIWGFVRAPLGCNGFQFSSVFPLLLYAHEVGK